MDIFPIPLLAPQQGTKTGPPHVLSLALDCPETIDFPSWLFQTIFLSKHGNLWRSVYGSQRLMPHSQKAAHSGHERFRDRDVRPVAKGEEINQLYNQQRCHAE